MSRLTAQTTSSTAERQNPLIKTFWRRFSIYNFLAKVLKGSLHKHSLIKLFTQAH